MHRSLIIGAVVAACAALTTAAIKMSSSTMGNVASAAWWIGAVAVALIADHEPGEGFLRTLRGSHEYRGGVAICLVAMFVMGIVTGVATGHDISDYSGR